MTYYNKFGQSIEPGDVVTHTTASQYASASIGFVRAIREVDNWGGRDVKADVTWVWNGWHKKGYLVKTSVALSTVTKVDPTTLSQELQEILAGAK